MEMGSTATESNNSEMELRMLRFFKEFRQLECTMCAATIGFQHKTTGGIVCMGLEACGCLSKVLAGHELALKPVLAAPRNVEIPLVPVTKPLPSSFLESGFDCEVLKEKPLQISTPSKSTKNVELSKISVASSKTTSSEPEPRKKILEDTVDAVKPSIPKPTLEIVQPKKSELNMKGGMGIETKGMSMSNVETTAKKSVPLPVIEKPSPQKVEKPVKIKREEVQPASEEKTWMNMRYSPNLKTGSVVSVVFSWNPVDYQVVATDDAEKLEVFQAVLQNYVEEGKLAKFTRPPQKDDLAVAEYDGAYYRARVTAASSNSSQLCFIDYGDKTVVSNKNLLEMSEEMFKTPVFGLKVRLDGVDNVVVNAETQLGEEIEGMLYETPFELKLLDELDMRVSNALGILTDPVTGNTLNAMVKSAFSEH